VRRAFVRKAPWLKGIGFVLERAGHLSELQGQRKIGRDGRI
jgi:hypothetical protein